MPNRFNVEYTLNRHAFNIELVWFSQVRFMLRRDSVLSDYMDKLIKLL